MLARTLLFLAGILLAAPVLILTIFALVTPITLSGRLYLLGSLLVAAGLVLAAWQPRAPFIALSGLVVILAVAAVRIGLSRNEDSNLKIIILPSAKGTRLINSLFDERDSLLFGERILHLIGGVSPREHEGIVPALSASYREATEANSVFASPIVRTYLGLQKPEAFDAVVIEPSSEQPPAVGVIFLHGLMGNVSLQCWQIARATAATGALTVCPSTGWMGHWWTPEGQAIIRATFAYLRERGIQRVYLGGFSNGGNGVGSYVSMLASEKEHKGLFFIAGVRNAEQVRKTGLPVLVIQGTNDERIPVGLARQFAGEIGEQATYVELEADHFLIMKQPLQVQHALSAWLAEQE